MTSPRRVTTAARSRGRWVLPQRPSGQIEHPHQQQRTPGPQERGRVVRQAQPDHSGVDDGEGAEAQRPGPAVHRPDHLRRTADPAPALHPVHGRHHRRDREQHAGDGPPTGPGRCTGRADGYVKDTEPNPSTPRKARHPPVVLPTHPVAERSDRSLHGRPGPRRRARPRRPAHRMTPSGRERLSQGRVQRRPVPRHLDLHVVR
ncbi:hypothetical protein GALL_323940 [mine drainage metagenome]|uniref:Uncharacterized protein n=1 Tax=mine drainage metagenome TaxID=410659 RepID=A0A1J5RC88_9ZZZZ